MPRGSTRSPNIRTMLVRMALAMALMSAVHNTGVQAHPTVTRDSGAPSEWIRAARSRDNLGTTARRQLPSKASVDVQQVKARIILRSAAIFQAPPPDHLGEARRLSVGHP